MRPSSNSIQLLTFDESEVPAGICLGSDHCSEHEMGMKPLENALGVGTRGKRGLAVHLAQPINPDEDLRLAFYEREKGTKKIPAEVRLVFCATARIAQAYADPEAVRGLPKIWMENGKPGRALATGWDEDGFIIRAFGDAERQMVRDLYEGLQQGDVLLSFGGTDNPFDRGGPCLTLRSRMSDEVDRQVAELQDDHRRLADADMATGIREKLESAGLRFHALSSAWKSDDRQSNHPVEYFLNPSSLGTFKAGWFSVEDLEAWIRGEGPVIVADKAPA